MGVSTGIKQIIRFYLSEKNKKNIQHVTVTKYNSELLADKSTLIVGGTGDIGLSIAKAFADAGSCIVITGSKEKTVDETITRLRKDDYLCEGIVVDLLDISSFPSKILEAQNVLGKQIDIVVNAAGYHGNEKFGEITEQSYDRIELSQRDCTIQKPY